MASHRGQEMTDQMRVFAREYLKDLNGTQAAIRSKYSKKSAASMASQLLSNPKVVKEIQRLMDARSEKLAISAEKTLAEIARLGFFDAADVCGAYEVKSPADIARLPEDVRRCVTGWKWDRHGNLVVQFADKLKALELLGKHLKLFTDRVEHTADDSFTALLDRASRQKEAALADRASENVAN